MTPGSESSNATGFDVIDGKPADWRAKYGFLARIEERIHEAELANREDLRGQMIVTIDPDDAKDFDDAIHVQRHANGWSLGVHIADVSHYVQPRSALDRDIAHLKTAAARSKPADVFMTAPSPGILTRFIINLHYPNEEAYVEALAEFPITGTPSCPSSASSRASSRRLPRCWPMRSTASAISASGDEPV